MTSAIRKTTTNKLTVAAAWVGNSTDNILAVGDEFGDEMTTTRRRAEAKFTNEIISNCREVRISNCRKNYVDIYPCVRSSGT